MFDIGVNLTSSQFYGDESLIVTRAQQKGIAGLILIGSDLEDSQQVLALAQRWPGYCYTTAGIHPHHAKQINSDSCRLLEQLVIDAGKSVVGIGECGLDFNRNFSPAKLQEQAFEMQLELAAKLQRPIYMHCRDAHKRFIEILAPWRSKIPGAVLHCFTGSEQELMECLSLDLYIGVTGWICDERRGETLRKLVPLIPKDRLLLETDAPYLLPRDLSPKPKSRRNEPAYLTHICDVVAMLRDENATELQAQLAMNSRVLFGVN